MANTKGDSETLLEKLNKNIAHFLNHPRALPSFEKEGDPVHESYWKNLVSRTSERFIPKPLLDAVRRIPVAFLGGGTVGGNAIVAWFNLGGENILISEPASETVEPANYLRQAFNPDNNGVQKAVARRENLMKVNPHANIVADQQGVTEESIKGLVDSSAIIVDGVEFYRIREIIRLHQEAARQQKPVFVGLDLGFTDTVILYDYRTDSRPFYGKLDALIPYAEKAQALCEAGMLDVNTFQAFVLYFAAQMIPHETIPVEQLREIQAQLEGRTENVAQLASTGNNLGNRVALSILALIAGKPVKHVSYSNSLQTVIDESPESIEKTRQAVLKDVMAQLDAIGENIMNQLDQVEI